MKKKKEYKLADFYFFDFGEIIEQSLWKKYKRCNGPN